MKTSKLIVAVSAILLFTNLLFAANPQTPDKEDKLADLLIEKMGKDVTLNDSQKISVRQKLKIYILKMQNANEQTNSVDKFALKNQATVDYQLSLDSILTPIQREQLETKIKERTNAK
ncbi:MAG TPA: hypothetical protein VFK73_07715 [Paludibacter sp.]|nr:hypothetical protein [Paludibacter sp.]